MPAPPVERPPRVTFDAVQRFLSFARPYRSILLAASVLMLLSSLLSLALPLLARTMLDHIQRTRSLRELDLLALALIALVLLSSIITYAQSVMVAYVGNRIVTELRARLFAHLMRLPVVFFDRTRSGDLTSRLANDVTLMQQTLADDLVQLARNIVRLIGGFVLVAIIDARLTLFVAAIFVVTVSVFLVLGRAVRRLTRQGLDALADTMGAMSEALANVRLVKSFARERHESERMRLKLAQIFALNMKGSLLESAFSSIAFSGFILVFVGVIWYGGRGVLIGSLTVGALVAFIMTLAIISGPMGTLALLYSRMQRALGAAERIFQMLDTAPEPPDEPDALPFPQGAGHVRFHAIDFRYTPDIPVLTDLSLDLPAGQVTALVGASGSGKTTLANLLYRFYDAQAGTITIDGVPLERIRREDLREQIGIVPQEPILFNGTIRENIRYGRLDATDAEIEEAAGIANVSEFAQVWPDNYDTVLGERGITLSGGQRQRVAIARAVLKNPRILILDEATSALDTRSEALVREALERLMRNRTTLVIAHRLTTIQNADQIAVIDDGHIAEIGAHDTLLRRGERYAELHGQAAFTR